jgi:hypothetical protein
MSAIVEYFHIPKSGKTKQRIPLKEIIDQLAPSSHDKRVLISEISSIHLEGVLDSQSLRVPTYRDDEYHYEAIYVLDVELKSYQHFTVINEKLHQTFPNPIVIIFHFNGKYILSVAPKRINKIDKEKSVIEGYYASNAFVVEDNHIAYLYRLNINDISCYHLKDFYDKLVDVIYSERLIEFIGAYPTQTINTKQFNQFIKLIESDRTELNALKERYKQASMMSEKMDIHMQISNSEHKVQQMICQLKEELLNE